MATKKTLVLSGYYGFDNAGDEAVLHSIVQALKQACQGQDLEIIVLSNQPEKTMKLYGVKAINRWDIKAIYKQIKNCDLLISGGGSLLQDVTSNKTVPYYLFIIKIAQWHKKQVVFYSQGFGPVNKGHSKFLVKKVLNKVQHIFVRDENSKKGLMELGVTRPNIKVTIDPVIGMKPNPGVDLKMKKYMESYPSTGLRVGIYLRSWKDDEGLSKKAAVLAEGLHKEGLDVYFIPMQQPQDVDFLKGVSFPEGTAHKLTDPLEVEEVFALTGQMDIVIGMRLHAVIMATAQGLPSVGLSYDPKVDNFMSIIENEHCYDVETFDPEVVIKNVIGLAARIKTEKENILCKRQELMDKVYKPATQVNELLG